MTIEPVKSPDFIEPVKSPDFTEAVGSAPVEVAQNEVE